MEKAAVQLAKDFHFLPASFCFPNQWPIQTDLIFRRIDASKKLKRIIGGKTGRHSMKKYLLAILVLFITASHLSAKTAWESYLTLPIPERASSVVHIEYSADATTEDSGGREGDLNILRDQVLACDREAFRLAYRLIGNAGDGLRENLIAILGHTIRTHPEFFLKEMSKLHPGRDVLKSILMTPGSEYMDRNYARRYELYMRRLALTDVSNLSLKEFRDACLELIEIN
jgi:hypothetical protein